MKIGHYVTLMLLKFIKIDTVVNFFFFFFFFFTHCPLLDSPFLNSKCLYSSFGPIFPMFDQIWLYDVITRSQNLKYWKNWFYIWISHPEISLKAYFQLYSSIKLLDIEFFYFPSVWLNMAKWRHDMWSKSKKYWKTNFFFGFPILKLI